MWQRRLPLFFLIALVLVGAAGLTYRSSISSNDSERTAAEKTGQDILATNIYKNYLLSKRNMSGVGKEFPIPDQKFFLQGRRIDRRPFVVMVATENCNECDRLASTIRNRLASKVGIYRFVVKSNSFSSALGNNDGVYLFSDEPSTASGNDIIPSSLRDLLGISDAPAFYVVDGERKILFRNFGLQISTDPAIIEALQSSLNKSGGRFGGIPQDSEVNPAIFTGYPTLVKYISSETPLMVIFTHPSCAACDRLDAEMEQAFSDQVKGNLNLIFVKLGGKGRDYIREGVGYVNDSTGQISTQLSTAMWPNVVMMKGGKITGHGD